MNEIMESDKNKKEKLECPLIGGTHCRFFGEGNPPEGCGIKDTKGDEMVCQTAREKYLKEGGDDKKASDEEREYSSDWWGVP